MDLREQFTSVSVALPGKQQEECALDVIDQGPVHTGTQSFRSISFRSVPKSGTLRACVHTGTLEITSFRSKKWNDEKSDTKSGTIRNRSVPFPCEQAMRSKLVQKTER